MMDPMHLIRLHLKLECRGIDESGQMYSIACPNPDTILRVYIARHDLGDSIFFYENVPEATRSRLRRLPIADFFEFPERVKAVLQEDGPVAEMHIGKSYVFPESIRLEKFPDVVRLSQVDPEIVWKYDPGMTASEKEVFGVLVDGQVVSSCESSREDDEAGEAWVRTLEPYRRRGYARQVTAAWASWLQQHGKVPFYSHTWENMASQSVAQSLGLIQYIADAGYS